ncbi:hypothetical protein [Luteibacter sp. HA06]
MSVLTLRGKSWVPNSYRSEFGSLAEEVAMSDVEVHIELEGTTRQVGLLRHHSSGRGETATFEYTNEWLGSVACFSIEPALRPTKGLFSPPPGMSLFGSLGDSAPDTWGRRIMQRAERRNADRECRRVRTLGELDYLLGVSDETRLGAMRFRRVGEKVFQAPDRTVPPVVELGRLLQVTERLLRDEETCSIDLLESAAAFFGLQLPAARKIIRGVADVTKTWRDVARDVGSREPEIRRMESAFEHDDLEKALGR